MPAVRWPRRPIARVVANWQKPPRNVGENASDRQGCASNALPVLPSPKSCDVLDADSRRFPGIVHGARRSRARTAAAWWKKADELMNSADHREKARRRIALGRCAICGHGPLVTKNLCSSCRESVKAAAQRRRERLKSAGICFECGQAPAKPGVLRCAKCTVRATLRTRRAEVARKAAALKNNEGCPDE